MEGIEDTSEPDEFKSRRLDALANLMLSYESLGRMSDVARIAEILVKDAPSNSWHNIQASAVQAALNGDRDETVKKLLSLERKARRYNHNVIAENILLDLAYSASSATEAKRYLQKVRSDDERMYNYIRATAKFALLTINSDGPSALSSRDIAAIEAGYTFMFSQRMVTLLTQFHEVICRILEERGDRDRQIELLKHSSFVWRLRGDLLTEQRYLRLVEGHCAPERASSDGPLRRAMLYILARLRGLTGTSIAG